MSERAAASGREREMGLMRVMLVGSDTRGGEEVEGGIDGAAMSRPGPIEPAAAAW